MQRLPSATSSDPLNCCGSSNVPGYRFERFANNIRDIYDLVEVRWTGKWYQPITESLPFRAIWTICFHFLYWCPCCKSGVINENRNYTKHTIQQQDNDGNEKPCHTVVCQQSWQCQWQMFHEIKLGCSQRLFPNQHAVLRVLRCHEYSWFREKSNPCACGYYSFLQN